MRKAGGLCIVDEVQSGLGRNGESWWEFLRHGEGAVPDIVTCGKGLGGGTWPLAAVVTRSDVSGRLVQTGLEHFNTNAGTNAAGAVGSAVLKVVREERLMQRAHDVGRHWLHGLRALQRSFPQLIADVRGIGLFLGVELAQPCGDGGERPLAAEASWLVNRLRSMEDECDGRSVAGVLLSVDGPQRNVLKLKPPMSIGVFDVDCTLRCMDKALHELSALPTPLT